MARWLVDDQGVEWLDAYGGHAVASTGHSHPAVVTGHRGPGRHAALLFGRRRPSAPRAAGRSGSWRCCPGRSTRSSSATRARKPTRTPSASRGSAPAARTIVSRPRRLAWAHAGVPGLHRWRPVRGGREARRHPALDQGAASTISPPSTRRWTTTVAAVIVEPVQGIQGARDCSPEFLRGGARRSAPAPARRCIFDEIQCGIGRCGAFTAAEAVRRRSRTPSRWPRVSRPAADRRRDDHALARRGPRHRRSRQHLRRRPGASAPPRSPISMSSSRRAYRQRGRVGTYIRDEALGLGVHGGAGTRAPPRAPARPARRRGPAGALRPPDPHRDLGRSGRAPPLPPLTFSRAEADLLLAALDKVLGMTKRDFLAMEEWTPERDRRPPRPRRAGQAGRDPRRAREEGAGDGLHGPEPPHPRPASRRRCSCTAATRVVLEPGKGSWTLETEIGAVMDGAGVEHIIGCRAGAGALRRRAGGADLSRRARTGPSSGSTR